MKKQEHLEKLKEIFNYLETDFYKDVVVPNKEKDRFYDLHSRHFDASVAIRELIKEAYFYMLKEG